VISRKRERVLLKEIIYRVRKRKQQFFHPEVKMGGVYRVHPTVSFSGPVGGGPRKSTVSANNTPTSGDPVNWFGVLGGEITIGKGFKKRAKG